VQLGLFAAFATLAVSIGTIAPAAATQSVVAQDFPVWNQPRVMDGRVYAIDSFGDDVIVGGTFTTIRNAPTSSPQVSQSYLFKFNVATGQIDTAFVPQLDAEVEGVAISDDGTSVYVAGDFTTVNGQTKERIVKLSFADGSVDPAFTADANNEVKDMALTGNQIIVGGRFKFINGQQRDRLAAVDATTGAVLASFNVPITGSRYQYAEYVQELDVSADGRWLVVGGNFMKIGGQDRAQIGVIDLSGGTATVANWATDRYVPQCSLTFKSTYIRGVDIAPDSSWFVVNTTGAWGGANSMCDTATRWELPPTSSGTGLQPTWVDYTGGDTLWAVEITDAAVYVGGHQRWENNPTPTPG